jgi:putative PIN family toxin of toxin-antitoxin system
MNPQVVLDTNVLVSAIISPRGNPSRIVEALLAGRLTACYSDEIMAEYEDVLLRKKFRFSTSVVHTLLNYIAISGRHTAPHPSNVYLPDESDRCFYDVARHARAVLITGNIKHYPIASFILTPAAFINTTA